MKNGTKSLLLLTAAALSVVGCSPTNRVLNKTFSTLNWEAGKKVDEGNFGDPTLNNEIAQLAYSDQGGIIANLTHKFEKDVPTMINFEFNKYSLDAEAKSILTEQAAWIRQFPEIKFRVYGHTDLVGSAAANKRLGLNRARAVVRFLVSQGVDGGRLEAMVSFGETQPLIVTEGRERKNRRTVTEVIGFARAYEGTGLDGQYAQLLYRRYVTSDLRVTEAKSN